MKKHSILAFVALVSMLSLATAFAAGDAAKQVATAEAHAKMASATKDINMVHAHLQHVVNCLVGPKGKLFDAKAEDPCKGMGDGALNDLTGSPRAHAKLEMAVETAERGIHETAYTKAHAAAIKTVALIKDANVLE
ncbi:MAG TPA: hypothetical protein VFK12_04365 [Gammaproteobacteria bacterium]|jgi:hypothetical protein|nr:hypothetical protein [Gammaproteobacteria bacterium]